MLILIPCGNKKLSHPAPAADLYIGPHYKFGLEWARSQAPDHRIRIVSAKHGLLPLDQVIAPYDIHLGHGQDEISKATLKEQAGQQGLLGETNVRGALPKAYVDLVRYSFPNLSNIFDQLPPKRRGIGCQNQLLKRLTQEAHR